MPKLTNKEIIRLVKLNQQGGVYIKYKGYKQFFPLSLPLTCGVNSGHKELIPKEINKKVVLICPTCEYTQKQIPKYVFRLPELVSALKAALFGH